MTSTGLFGPHALTVKGIDDKVGGGIGTYALGYVKDRTFYVKYVGRSDADLNDRLHKHVGEYGSFKYGHYDTIRDAYEQECRLYHGFGNLDNKIHPARPKGAMYGCPIAGCNY